MPELPKPDDLAERLLAEFFGSASLVVSTFLILNFLWSWWGLGRGTVSAASVILDRSHDRLERNSLKVGATARTAAAWALLYVVASFVTQIWAGSEFSPGQGGGLSELLTWSGIFGAIAVGGCFYLTPSRTPKHGDPHWAPLMGLFVGYFLGTVWAVVSFTAKNGPQLGDWWVSPAMSCIGVLGATLRMRIRTIKMKHSRQAR